MNKTIPTTIGILIVLLAAGIAGASVLLFNQEIEEMTLLEEDFFETDGMAEEDYLESETGKEDCSDVSIGDKCGGGILAYSHPLGEWLIAAESDISIGVSWGCYGKELGGTSVYYGTGKENTNIIISNCKEDNIAARVANKLTLNGYDDWFLPSRDELNILWCTIGSSGEELNWDIMCGDITDKPKKANIGGFKESTSIDSSPVYWSSSEVKSTTARGQLFNAVNRFNIGGTIKDKPYGEQNYFNKNASFYVRPVRIIKDFSRKNLKDICKEEEGYVSQSITHKNFLSLKSKEAFVACEDSFDASRYVRYFYIIDDEGNIIFNMKEELEDILERVRFSHPFKIEDINNNGIFEITWKTKAWSASFDSTTYYIYSVKLREIFKLRAVTEPVWSEEDKDYISQIELDFSENLEKPDYKVFKEYLLSKIK